MPAVPTLVQGEKEQLEKKIEQYRKKYKKDHWMYCFFYYLCTYGSAALSAAAATVVQITAMSATFRGNLASVLAGIATVFITVSAIGDYHGHLKANRMARYRLEQLLNRVAVDRQPDTTNYVRELNDIIGQWPLGGKT